jgi:hypothetical protein
MYNQPVVEAKVIIKNDDDTDAFTGTITNTYIDELKKRVRRGSPEYTDIHEIVKKLLNKVFTKKWNNKPCKTF